MSAVPPELLSYSHSTVLLKRFKPSPTIVWYTAHLLKGQPLFSLQLKSVIHADSFYGDSTILRSL